MDLFEDYSSEELKLINIDFLGLIKQPWEFSRGAKTQRFYQYPNETTAVRVYYVYPDIGDLRKIGQPKRYIEFYDAEGNLRLSYEITKLLNVKQLETLNRDIRQGRMDYMESAGKELIGLAPFMPEPYATSFKKASEAVTIINKFYEREIDDYIKHGSTLFENAVRNETNEILTQDIFSLEVRPPDELFPQGLTIKQTILHQLTGELV